MRRSPRPCLARKARAAPPPRPASSRSRPPEPRRQAFPDGSLPPSGGRPAKEPARKAFCPPQPSSTWRGSCLAPDRRARQSGAERSISPPSKAAVGGRERKTRRTRGQPPPPLQPVGAAPPGLPAHPPPPLRLAGRGWPGRAGPVVCSPLARLVGLLPSSGKGRGWGEGDLPYRCGGHPTLLMPRGVREGTGGGCPLPLRRAPAANHMATPLAYYPEQPQSGRV